MSYLIKVEAEVLALHQSGDLYANDIQDRHAHLERLLESTFPRKISGRMS